MKKAIVGLFIVCSGLLACGNSQSELPIEDEELVNILIDVHVAEAALQYAYGAKKDSLANLYYQEIYQIHDIEEADFEGIMAMLREDPAKMERIYKKVLDKIEKEDEPF